LLTAIRRSVELHTVTAVHSKQKSSAAAGSKLVRTADEVDRQRADRGLSRRHILNKCSGRRYRLAFAGRFALKSGRRNIQEAHDQQNYEQ